MKAHCIVCEELQRRFGAPSTTPRRSSVVMDQIKLTTSHDTAETILQDEYCEQEDESYHQCSICMESFEHNDLVSWSPSSECDHVFHHACIKTWLLHHECCPYCRVCFLSVDNRSNDTTPRNNIPTPSRGGLSLRIRGNKSKRRGNWGNDHLQELAVQRHQRLVSTYFCLKDGLVTLEKPLSICLCDMKSSAMIDTTNSTTELSKSVLRQFLVSDVPVQPNEMMALRTHPKSIRSTSDVVITITTTSTTFQNIGATEAVSMYDDNTAIIHLAEQQNNTAVDCRAANAIMDIETTIKELPIISYHVSDRNDDAV